MTSNTCPFRRTDICPAHTGARCTEWGTDRVWCRWRSVSRFHRCDRTLHIYLRTRRKTCERCKKLPSTQTLIIYIYSIHCISSEISAATYCTGTGLPGTLVGSYRLAGCPCWPSSCLRSGSSPDKCGGYSWALWSPLGICRLVHLGHR